MSFLGVLTGVLKPVLKIAPLIVTGLNPAIGALVTAGAAVITAELEHGDGDGSVKLDQASKIVIASPIVADSPVPPSDKAKHVIDLINGLVAILNALAGLFPNVPTTVVKP